MNDGFDLVERPDRAQLEAARVEIIAFREAHPTLTKTGLAVAFVDKRGSATSGELATLLDLRPDQYPSVELSSAVQNGRLVRDGKNWELGPHRVAYQGRSGEQKPDALESGAELGRVNKPLDVPVFAAKPAPLPQPKPEPAPTPTAKPTRCRFARWSDGQVEIVGGLSTVKLSREEFDDLVQFVRGAP